MVKFGILLMFVLVMIALVNGIKLGNLKKTQVDKNIEKNEMTAIITFTLVDDLVAILVNGKEIPFESLTESYPLNPRFKEDETEWYNMYDNNPKYHYNTRIKHQYMGQKPIYESIIIANNNAPHEKISFRGKPKAIYLNEKGEQMYQIPIYKAQAKVKNGDSISIAYKNIRDKHKGIIGVINLIDEKSQLIKQILTDDKKWKCTNYYPTIIASNSGDTLQIIPIYPQKAFWIDDTLGKNPDNIHCTTIIN